MLVGNEHWDEDVEAPLGGGGGGIGQPGESPLHLRPAPVLMLGGGGVGQPGSTLQHCPSHVLLQQPPCLSSSHNKCYYYITGRNAHPGLSVI
jgi:hypothetical protein